MATETRFWTEEEDRLVLLSRLPAKQLSAELDRSCLAIYSRRAYLRSPEERRASKSRGANYGAKEQRRKARYYESGRANLSSHRSPWSDLEEAAIMADSRPCDHDLAGLLGRSVRAIQGRRHLLKSPQQ